MAKPARVAAEQQQPAVAVEKSRGDLRVTVAMVVLLVAVTLAIYWQAGGFELNDLDDTFYVVRNESVLAGLNGQSFRWAFTTFTELNWHPLTWLSLMVDAHLTRMWLDWDHTSPPPGMIFHITNVVLHVFNVLLLFALMLRLTGCPWRSGFVAALFAVHPMHVESVAWVTERKDVLSTFFWLLTMLAYVAYARSASSTSQTTARDRRNRKKDERDRQDAAAGLQAAKQWTMYGLTLLFLALGLMTKPMLVTLPLILLLVDLWPLWRAEVVLGRAWFGITTAVVALFAIYSQPFAGDYAILPHLNCTSLRGMLGAAAFVTVLTAVVVRSMRKPLVFKRGWLFWGVLIEKLPMFVLMGASAWVTWVAEYSQGGVVPFDALPVEQRAANAVVAVAAYISKMFWPINMACMYPHPGATIPTWQVVGSVAGLVVITAVAVWQLRRRPFIFVGWMWYLITLLPVIGLVQVGRQAMADRYTYVPYIGLFAIIAWGVPQLFMARGVLRKDAVITLGVLALAAVGALIPVAYIQTGCWHDSIVLNEHALEVTTDNFVAHNNLGFALSEVGRDEEAIDEFKKAIALKDDYVDAHYNLGTLYGMNGRFPEAEEQLKYTVELRPWHVDAWQNLGGLYVKLWQIDRARECFRQVLRIDPRNAKAIESLRRLSVVP